MLQVSGTWDLQDIHHHPSPLMKLYIFFLLLVWVFGLVKLVKTWIVVPPFGKRLIEKGDLTLRALEKATLSLALWSKATLLVSATFLMTTLADVSDRLMAEKAVGSFTILIITRDFAQALAFGLWSVLFLYVIRWHILHRISCLRM